jgi:hypothetical protein
LNIAAPSEAPGEAVVADYLANRLSEAEAQSFEHYCLEHPDFAREVECELALQTGLRQAHQSVAQVGLRTHERRYGRWPLALAASVVVLASAVLVIQYSKDKESPLLAFTSTVDIPDHLRRSSLSQVRLVRMRGNEATTQVSASINGLVEFQLLPDLSPKSGDYSLQIASESGSSTKPLIVKHLRPADNGYLQLYVPASQMIGQTWLISVAEDGDFGKSQSMEVFRVEFVAASESAN